GISAQAHAEIGDWLAVGGGALPVYLVSVREHRAVSTTIAERFGVRHESPQLLLVHGGVVRWHGSHFRVTPAAIDAAVGRLPRPPA
ncbi:MAG: thioredoxin family protein, partial [Acidobacteriota bacterium]|nr:thioredoxin family protein [Acidobacteriota bacterium]